MGREHSSQSALIQIDSMRTENTRAALSGETREAVDPVSSLPGSLHEWHSVSETLDLLTGTELVGQSSPLQVADPSDALIHDAPAAMPILAAGITIPSPEMLRGIVENGDHAASVGDVSRVLAEALAGGGGAPSIDQLLDALPTPGGGTSGLESFAGQNVAGGSASEGGLAGFMDQHFAYAIEQVMFHQDALPPA